MSASAPERLNPDYAEFCARLQKLDNFNKFGVARVLGLSVRDYIRDHFRESDEDRDETIVRFFQQVCTCTGVNSEAVNRQSQAQYYDQLIAGWQRTKKGSRTSELALATYYYLYTTRHGQRVVEKVDKACLGKAFHEACGKPVPGGFKRDAPPLSQLPDLVDEAQGGEHASYQRAPPSRSKLAWEIIGQEIAIPPIRSFVDLYCRRSVWINNVYICGSEDSIILRFTEYLDGASKTEGLLAVNLDKDAKPVDLSVPGTDNRVLDERLDILLVGSERTASIYRVGHWNAPHRIECDGEIVSGRISSDGTRCVLGVSHNEVARDTPNGGRPDQYEVWELSSDE